MLFVNIKKNKWMEEKEMRSEYISHQNNIIYDNKQVASVLLRERRNVVGVPFWERPLSSSATSSKITMVPNSWMRWC